MRTLFIPVLQICLLCCKCQPKVASKYLINEELKRSTSIISTNWIDEKSAQSLGVCQKNAHTICIGKQKSVTSINWQKTYNLPSTSRLDLYIEFQVSGEWVDQSLNFFANNFLMYTQTIRLSDQNRVCNENFLYMDYAYFEIVAQMDTLKLVIQATGVNLGLYIQNIIINQRTQSGKDVIIPFFDYIPQCSNGLEFVQYYCKCPPQQVFQEFKCQDACDINHLYIPDTNECELKANCDACIGKQVDLICNPDHFYITRINIQGVPSTECVKRCPNDYYPVKNSKFSECLELTDHLQKEENNKNPVDHYYFYKDTANFFHFFKYIYIKVDVSSIPALEKERPFAYINNQFVAGSCEPFQSQNLTLTTFVLNSQHRLIFRAIGHFVDFYPSRLDIYINKVLQDNVELIPTTTNEGLLDQDYIAYYDLNWTTTSQLYQLYNFIQFQVDQPLQNDKYQGYFYLEDIHIFQFRCIPNCDACMNPTTCTPCQHPANKNPDGCACLKGYFMVDDICITCPTYCDSCQTPDVCDSCVATTKRLNPPTCDVCPAQYFILADQDDCQSCMIGCQNCLSADACISCKTGYFINSMKSCVINCDDGYFNDNRIPLNPKCTFCNDNCLTCKNSAIYCTSCKENFQLISSVCYECPDGTYLSGTICKPCKTNCQICTNLLCLLCADSYFMQISTNQCVGLCNPDQFSNMVTKTCDLCNPLCSTCVGATPTDCITCPKGLVLNLLTLVVGECLTNCKPGYFIFGSVCAKCWVGCETCADYSQVCLTCAPNYYRLKSDQKCYSKCPDGYYNNVRGYTCSPCDPICKTCYSFSKLDCLSCALPLALFEYQCLTECPKGYGNVNAECKRCTTNCDKCFGIGPDECTDCTSGYYFLHNQCYGRCPKNYVGIRPQYMCKCIFENCVSCTQTQFNLDNVCYDKCPNGTFGFNGLCIKCDKSCGICSGEGFDQCDSCSFPLIFYQHTCLSQCENNTYHDITKNECLLCDDSCLACTGPHLNDCTACKNEQLLNVDGSCQEQCTSDSYVIISERRCLACHPTCLTCFGGMINNCLTCKKLIYLNECVDTCPSGFILSLNQTSCVPNIHLVLFSCSRECSTCELTERYCTACAYNRIQNPPFCNCEQGYFDDGIHGKCQQCANKCSACSQLPTKCKLCKGDRFLPNCSCPLYYYDDGESVQCSRCRDNCATCNKDQCLTCLLDRINPPDCICQVGYYEAFQPYCQSCGQQCATCTESDNLCLACAPGRIDPPVCGCPFGYFSNSDKECQKCQPTCIECYEKGCLSCAVNRKGPDGGICWCISPGVSRLSIGSLYCTDCQLGVPFFGLNDDFTGFYIDFGASVQIINDSNDNICNVIFEPETLLLLGDNPICLNDLQILFGENPTIQVGDNIKLNPSFKLIGCDQQFDEVQIKPLSIPSNIDIDSHKPLITINDLNNKNVCYPIQIEFLQKMFNGGQSFEIIKWEILLPTNPDPQISQLLQLNQANNSEVIIFPIMFLQADNQYKFQVTLESFAKLQNAISIEFTPILRSTIYFDIKTDQNQYQRFDQIKLPFQIKYLNCIEKIPPPQILYYQIQLQNNNDILLYENLTFGLIDGFVFDIELSIESYYFNFSNPYSLVFTSKLVRADYVETTFNTFDIFIVPSIPKLKIQGSSRMIGYEDQLDLSAIVLDLDFSQIEVALMVYECTWKCTDISNGQECKDTADYTLIFDNNCNQTIKAKTFAPYNVFNFQVSIYKNDVLFSTNVSIATMEMDLPILNVSEVNINQVYNYYDEFILKIQYPGINPDLLMYAGAVVYNQIVVQTFEFYYLDFKFKLQDYFSNLTLQEGNEIRLRLSVYDPHFVMPSVKTIILPMNIPPQNCQVQYNKNMIIEFLDDLNINVINCQDSQGLLYSVYLYANQSIYQQDLLKARFYHNLLLIPPQQNTSFNIIIPYYNQQSNLLVVLIKDNIGGIQNITTTIPVRQYNEINEDTFRNYLNQQYILDYQLIGYRVVVEKLSLLDGLLNYKEELFKQLINLDQNQTFLSNQTECIYHSISIIIGQNCSLLQFDQTQFFNQLNYRINKTAIELIKLNNLQISSQLTSQLNLEKQNYIQQYYSFANILSQFVKFKVSVNETSTEIQSSLNSIMDYLQSISLPNEPLFTIQSNSANMNFGYLTSKMVKSITSTSLSSEEKSQNQTNTNFYKFSQTRYIDNPYYSTEGFPKNSSGYQAIDPKIQSTNSNSNNSLSSPMSFKFPAIKKLAPNTTLQCVGQVSADKWSADVCKSVQKDGQVICQCNTLNPTSIMESLDYIMDKAEQIFSMDTLAAFLTFPFYKAVIFYFYLTITIAYVYIIYWGLKADNLMFERIQIEKELEEKKKLEEEKEQEEQNKQKDNESQENFDDIPIIEPITIFSKNKVYIEDQFQCEINKSFNPSKNYIEIKSLASNEVKLENQLQGENDIAIKNNFQESPNQQELDNHKLVNKPEIQEAPKALQSIKKTVLVFPEFLKYFHQILSIIHKDDETKPRGLRATIIYTSIMGSLVVLFVFNQPDNLSLTMALALITAPLNKIYQILLEKLLSHKKKPVRVIGAIFMIVVAGFISYTMLAGLVLSGSVEASNKWSYIFIGSLTLDNMVYSPIQLVIQYNIHIGKINFPILQQLLNKLLDEQAKKYIQKIVEQIK